MVLLTRHTRPAVAANLCYGRLEVPLATTAALEIDAVCARLRDVAQVISSPSRRCAELAAAVATRFAARLEFDPALLELDFGAWEGLTWEQIGRPAVEAWAREPWSFRPGGGESLAELWARVEAMAYRRRLAAADSAAATLLMVTHHGPLRVLQCVGAGSPPSRFFAARFGFGAEGLRRWPSTDYPAKR